MSKTVPVDLVFRAFSDKTRLRIMNLLTRGELCVCDLVAIIGAPQPKISRHLSYLRRAGLVSMRKDGLWCHYRLAPPRGQFHTKMLDCLRGCYGGMPQLQRDSRKLPKKAGTCC